MTFFFDPEDQPNEPQPPAPAYHVDSHGCDYGMISWTQAGVPYWMPCNCEDPAQPWPPRDPTDGPPDCQCALCEGTEPRYMRGRTDGCEYKNHHCPMCHEHRFCTVVECGFGREIDRICSERGRKTDE